MNLQDLHAVSPYKDFPYQDYPCDVFVAWGSEDPGFTEVIQRVQPKLIIEVGTWKGGSALHMARLSPDSTLVCVDTWLGALEFWTDQNDETRYQALDLMYGYPMVYYQFLANVMHAGYQDRIIPFPVPSLIAARWFRLREIQADLVYVDASHDYDDVLADLRAYWPIVRPGGMLFGDDWGVWPGVHNAVRLFSSEVHTPIEASGRHWRMTKGT